VDAPDLPTPPDPEQGENRPTALAAAEQPVDLSVRLLEDERTPEGMVCMGTYRGERLIARCVIPPETWEQVTAFELFGEPVPVVLMAREAPPGLQCQLFALLALPIELLEGDDDEEEDGEEEDEEGDDEEESPWAASLPGSSYEREVAGDEEDEEDDDEDRVVAFPLGQIVRFDKDRLYPDNLPLETADVLRRLIEGRTYEVVDKALEDLLGG
jgi:hypothetical protein